MAENDKEELSEAHDRANRLGGENNRLRNQNRTLKNIAIGAGAFGTLMLGILVTAGLRRDKA